MADRAHADQATLAAFDTVLITGADGFVGRHFAPALAHRLKSTARLALASRFQVLDQATGALMAFDLTNPASVRAVIERVRPDLIVHLAGQAVTGGAQAARATWTLNFGGTSALAEAVSDFVPHATLLAVSSSEVYGRAFNRGKVSETTLLDPISTYARSKAATEAMLTDVLPTSCRLIVARPSNHIGVGQSTAFAIPAFAAQIAAIERAGGGVVRVGNLHAERDFMHVADVVEAYLGLIFAAGALPTRSVFNIASGRLVKVGDLLNRLCDHSTAKITIETDPNRWRPLDVPRAAVDASAVTTSILWRPVRTLDEAIREVLAEHREAIN